MTEAPNHSIGAHPITRSESNKTYWKSITGSAITGRTVELASVAQTPKVTDTFTPLFDQGSFMDRATAFARRFTKPALITGGATAGIAGAAVIIDLDGNYASAQEPSAAPSAAPSLEPVPSVTPNPETGLAVPCPIPTPEATPTPLPDRTLPPDIGRIPQGDIFIAQGENSNKDIVIITLAQEAPASPTASEGPITARVDCDFPDTIRGFVESVTNKYQEPSEIEPVKFKQLKEAILGNNPKKGEEKIVGFLEKYAVELADYTIPAPFETQVTREMIDTYMNLLQKGRPDDNTPADKIISRALAVSGVSFLFAFIGRDIDNPELEADVQKIIDLNYRYGVSQIDPKRISRTKEQIDLNLSQGLKMAETDYAA